jgi:hypothetical protein
MDIRRFDQHFTSTLVRETVPMALREVRDERGMLWTIYDVHPSTVRHGMIQVREELASGWLCFQSEAAKRRLVGIPDQWEQMEDGALMSLMTAAALVSASTNKLPQS